MIKIENVETVGWEHAIRGMRNPMNSWEDSDSHEELLDDEEYVYVVGKKDKNLMLKLAKAGTSHSKYLRMIGVYADITCNHTWWAEFDTYKVGTVRNSCSKMHKIHVKPFKHDDFSHEGIEEVGGATAVHFQQTIMELERLRLLFNRTGGKRYWRAIIELLPMGYNLRATVYLNYQVLRNIYHDRQNHKMFEWREFCKWIETLPHSELITTK